METVWLNQNISAWNTPAAWYYWDEDTQSGQPYSQVPQDNDVVYLNGYTIGNLINANIVCLCHIKNTLNPYTQRVGGSFATLYNNRFQFKTIEVGDTTMFSGGVAINYSNWVTAEDIRLTGSGMLYQKTLGGTVSFVITGNIFCNNMGITLVNSAGGLRCVITGNIYTERLITQVTNNDISINGNVSLKNTHVSDNTNELTINGIITIDNAYLGEANTTNINGQMEYNNYNPIKGLIRTENLLINDNFAITRLGDIDGSIIKTQYQLNNTDQYPPENEVKEGTEYAWGEKVGTYTPDYPPESVVLKDFEYGDSDDRKTGTMEQEVNVEVGCVTPEDVRKDVPLVGMGVVGSLVVPSVDDVREGVIFDNGSVGTLIVEGGGDRLRIADFGYYTNAQSDTYIVDLTEQDKPKFAVAEERVLIEMFPELDLNNIPDKYFDDLFVKYLKYRLIVEYYRTAGINSTFTPSEPTTEIVNYQNVRNEVWLNSANIYLKAWGKKYPESIVKPQRILL